MDWARCLRTPAASDGRQGALHYPRACKASGLNVAHSSRGRTAGQPSPQPPHRSVTPHATPAGRPKTTAAGRTPRLVPAAARGAVRPRADIAGWRRGGAPRRVRCGAMWRVERPATPRHRPHHAPPPARPRVLGDTETPVCTTHRQPPPCPPSLRHRWRRPPQCPDGRAAVRPPAAQCGQRRPPLRPLTPLKEARGAHPGPLPKPWSRCAV